MLTDYSPEASAAGLVVPSAPQRRSARDAGGEFAQSSRRAALARRAREYLEANLDRPISLRALSAITGRSERMLQYVFREIYGMGPHAWFQAERLEAANRELRAGALGAVRVTDVALRWGFTHLGRFSVEYRRRFGEPPSQTLKRSRCGESRRNRLQPAPPSAARARESGFAERSAQA